MAKVQVRTTANMKTADGVPLLAEEIPAKILDAMLRAEADVVEPEIVKNADVMLHGKYWTGTTAGAVTRKKPEYAKASDGTKVRQMLITFTGVRDDKYHNPAKSKEKDRRNAAIAFINEYGARTMGPRPFMSKAVDDKEHEAQNAGEAVFGAWAEKNT